MLIVMNSMFYVMNGMFFVTITPGREYWEEAIGGEVMEC